MIIVKIVNKLKKLYWQSSSARFCRHLRNVGVLVGEGTYIDPHNFIDITRPSLVTIGKNCYINSGFKLLTHDWVTHIFIHSGRDYINNSGSVTIGNNVAFGQNVTVLKGVTIGDNTFIGLGSIVTKDIPANSIAIGAPCKVVMSLDDYYSKRKQISEQEAFEYIRSIRERFGRDPYPEELFQEFIWFVDGQDIDKYPQIPIRRELGPSTGMYIAKHKAKYKNLTEFIAASNRGGAKNDF